MKAAGRRIKGSKFERQLVKLHQDQGVMAKRVPLSGAMKEYQGDVIIADVLRGEAKCRKNAEGFRTLEGWLLGNDLLFLKKDRSDPFVAMTFATYMRLVKSLVMTTPEGE